MECDLENLQSTVICASPEPAQKGRDADTSSLHETEVRVLGPSADVLPFSTSSTGVKTVFGASPAGTSPNTRVQGSGEHSPEPSDASESAVLTVEDLGRTREC